MFNYKKYIIFDTCLFNFSAALALEAPAVSTSRFDLIFSVKNGRSFCVAAVVYFDLVCATLLRFSALRRILSISASVIEMKSKSEHADAYVLKQEYRIDDY